MKGKLCIGNITFHAFHGCMSEEASIGGQYRVDVEIEMDFSKPMKSDTLDDTVDYALVYEIVRDQMAVRSNLIEHVCFRIQDSLAIRVPGPKRIKVIVTKYHPPVSGAVGEAVFISESAYNE